MPTPPRGGGGKPGAGNWVKTTPGFCSARPGLLLNPGYGSRREELHEMIVDLVRRFLLEVVAGRQWLRVDEVAGVFAPDGRKFVGRWPSARAPQDQQWHSDLPVL